MCVCVRAYVCECVGIGWASEQLSCVYMFHSSIHIQSYKSTHGGGGREGEGVHLHNVD